MNPSRNRLVLLLIVITTGTTLCIGILASFTVGMNHIKRQRLEVTYLSTTDSAPTAQVVQSGDKKLRNIFYNRAGKCGSRSLISVVSRLSKLKNFTMASSSDMKNARPVEGEVHSEAVKITTLQPPTFYNRHIHFIDFAKYGFEKPIYINMIRDPIERFASQYNYLKYGDISNSVRFLKSDMPDISDCVMQNMGLCNRTQFMFYMGMYLCGMDPICERRDNKGRVDLAIKHVEEEYAFVGITEEFENTLKILEKMIPEYFDGALAIWKRNNSSKDRTKTKRFDILSDAAIERLRKVGMVEEYEVYEYAKNKFNLLKERFGIS